MFLSPGSRSSRSRNHIYSSIYLPAGASINWNNGEVTLTQSASNTLNVTTSSASGALFILQNNDSGTSGAFFRFYHNSSSPAIDDPIGQFSFVGKDSNGNDFTYANVTCRTEIVTDGSEKGKIRFNVSGIAVDLSSNTTGFFPVTNDGFSLGVAGNAWSDLFLASGGVINFNNGDVTLTHNSPDAVTVAGGSWVVGNGAISTTATDGFLYIPTCAGTPTGTPTTRSGTVAMVYDTSNNKLYIYNGAWKGGTTPGAWT